MYLPRDSSKTRFKRDRYQGYARMGIMAAYASELVPSRAYVIIDEVDLFQCGKFRLLVSEVVRLVETESNRMRRLVRKL